MENEIIGEQPNDEITQVQSGIVESEVEGTSCDNFEGSLGKFKDVESMTEAYNNLQAEFTRKCQKLSEVTKELETIKNEASNSFEPVVYNSEGWKQKVENFLDNNSEAKKYSGEIANEILNDENLKTSPNALELAWARVMQKNYREPTMLAKDQKFIDEQILSQQSVKQQVLDEYFKNYQNFKTPPVISSSGMVASIAPKQPQDLKEAKTMVEQLFNLKGI